MADVKSLLKEARKLIDEKNYIEAQECCKNILRKDKQNYLGFVLFGKSLQDSEQAVVAFQKAISSKPDHPLAWQGLANYYEKKTDLQSKRELLKVYGEILKLQIEEEKALEVINKVSELGSTLKDNKSIAIVLDYMDKNHDNKINTLAEKSLIQLCKSDIQYHEDDIMRIIDKLKSISDKENNDSLNILLAEAILQKNLKTETLEEVMRLKCFNSSVIFREWLCKFLCTKFIRNESFCGLDIEKYKESIVQGIENSKYPGLLNSMICYSKGLYLDAYKQCVPLIKYEEADQTEATFITKCAIMLKEWSLVEQLATNFLKRFKDNTVTTTLKKFLFSSLAEQQKWKQAIAVSKEIPTEILNLDEQASLAKCYIEINEQADHVMKNLHTTEHHLQLKALSLIKEGKYSDAIALLEQVADNPQKLFYIGKSYWELQQYDKSYTTLLQAAKLDADHSDTFNYLGMFYDHCKQDYHKAKKCYEKAYRLNNLDRDILKNLSNVYIKLNLMEDNFTLLNNASQNLATDELWISFCLGLYYINSRQWEKAILQFRNVIKTNHNDVIAFECLADAYFSRGSFTSALKAYNRVIMMNSNKTLHCLIRIGYIHSILTQYDETIKTFERVLKIDPYSMLALKGIAETWMKIASKKFDAKLYGSARDTTQNAINYIVRALSKDNNISCFWNLLGNALFFITKLPDKYSFVWLEGDENKEIKRIQRLNIYPKALACYSTTAKLKHQCTSYELACTYLDYYIASKNVLHCNIAYRLTIACIKLKPSAWRNWNLLGRICTFIKKYELAQHCFINALLMTRKWSTAEVWCNLGTLFIKMNLHKSANYCFWRGQSTLPSYPNSWIGQALIAEVIREEEAMDLFRHASRLGYHPVSALGYADWVCRTIKHNDYKNNPELKYAIDGLDAVSYGMDLVVWVSTYETNNACVYNIRGILEEKTGLLSTALESYQKAFDNADNDKKNLILLNIGRVYLRLSKYDDAIKSYKAITEASLNSACGLALALYKKGLYEQAYSTYDTALHWLTNNDAEKSDLLVAMAGIVYMFKGVDDAKTLLFQSIQVSQNKPTANSLFAICSLGITNSDQSLSKLALGELHRFENEKIFGYDIGFLKSYVTVNKEFDLGVKSLINSITEYPCSVLLWSLMGQYFSDKDAKFANYCAQRALCSANYENNNADLSAKVLATASVAEHIAGNTKKASLLARKGLHMYPHHSHIWAALIFSIVSNHKWKQKSNWILNGTAHMRKNLQTSKLLNRWVNLVEKKICTQ